MQMLIIQRLCTLWLCMCCLVVQIKELNKVLLPPLLAEDNSNPSDIRRQLDSSWGFIRNPTYGQKQHTPRCFREPQAARTDGRNHHPQTVIRGTSGHMPGFFSMEAGAVSVRGSCGRWQRERRRRKDPAGYWQVTLPHRQPGNIASPGGLQQSEAPRNSNTVQCLQITAHNLLGNSAARRDAPLSDLPRSASCFPWKCQKESLMRQMSYANLRGGRAQLPCNSQNETRRQGWWWQLSSLIQMSLTFLFHLWHAMCSTLHWSSLPLWITQCLLWAVRLPTTVSLIREKISLVTFLQETRHLEE